MSGRIKMKIIDKFNLVLFSIIILVISLIICILGFGWLEFDLVIDGITYVVTHDVGSKVLIGICIVLIMLAIKSIFFNSFSKEKMQSKEGILLENDNGKLLVSRDTIESLTNAVVKSFETAENAMTKVEVDEESKVKIYITLFVHPDAVIKELSTKLQANVKDTIKKSLDLDVTEVNIRVKNIAVKKEPNIKE